MSKRCDHFTIAIRLERFQKDRPGQPDHERIIDLEIREDIGSSSVGAWARWPPSIDSAREIAADELPYVFGLVKAR